MKRRTRWILRSIYALLILVLIVLIAMPVSHGGNHLKTMHVLGMIKTLENFYKENDSFPDFKTYGNLLGNDFISSMKKMRLSCFYDRNGFIDSQNQRWQLVVFDGKKNTFTKIAVNIENTEKEKKFSNTAFVENAEYLQRLVKPGTPEIDLKKGK